MPTATIEEDDDGIRLDRWFQRHTRDISFNIVSRWSKSGAVRLNGARAGPGDRVAVGQVLTWPDELPVPVATRPVEKPRAPLSEAQIDYMRGMVLHMDANAIVINKPPGLATQGGTGITTSVDAMLDALQFDAPSRPRLVHRLDKDTSGVLLLARSAKAAAFFSKEFAGREASKTYWALTVDVPRISAGTIDAPIGKQAGTGGEKMQVDTEAGLKAKTRYRVIERAANRAGWVEFQPLTGRTHQIRVHAAAIGHPLVGDGKYGGKDSYLTGGISRKLHLPRLRLVTATPGGGELHAKGALPRHKPEKSSLLWVDLLLGAIELCERPRPRP